MKFDASKEHFVILHPQRCAGEPFKLLGCLIDPKLIMKFAIDNIMDRIRPRITALLRTRAHYDVGAMITQFKTHIWGIMEMHSGGIFHAATTHLDRLDDAQCGFLEKIEVSEEDAFLVFNFAPPVLRRNIAILGLIHKRVLKQCHPAFSELLPWYFDEDDELHGKNIISNFGNTRTK